MNYMYDILLIIYHTINVKMENFILLLLSYVVRQNQWDYMLHSTLRKDIPNHASITQKT